MPLNRLLNVSRKYVFKASFRLSYVLILDFVLSGKLTY